MLDGFGIQTAQPLREEAPGTASAFRTLSPGTESLLNVACRVRPRAGEKSITRSRVSTVCLPQNASVFGPKKKKIQIINQVPECQPLLRLVSRLCGCA